MARCRRCFPRQLARVNLSHTIAGQGRPTSPATKSMPRDTRTRRLTRSVPRAQSMKQGGAETTAPPIVSLLAGMARLVDLLPHRDQQAMEVTGGRCTPLFQHHPRPGVIEATSG